MLSVVMNGRPTRVLHKNPRRCFHPGKRLTLKSPHLGALVKPTKGLLAYNFEARTKPDRGYVSLLELARANAGLELLHYIILGYRGL